MKEDPNKKIKNRTMPDCTILPVLGYTNVAEAIEWLCSRFGFKERWRVGDHRAQLAIGNGAIVVTEQQNNNRGSVLMCVDNADAHYKNAVKQGARILSEPQNFPFGERQYTAEDPGGHHWTFSQSIKDVAPEEWGGVTAKQE
ncbi:MAG: glyoxalase [Bacteroidetes bacterium]|nr:glyoxalase [Bacteroidota bacterium]